MKHTKNAALACVLLLIAALFVGVSGGSAEAKACVTRTSVGGNLLFNSGSGTGGTHIWHIELTYQDCTGYDRVSSYAVVLQKENGRCSNGALAWVNNYDFNPNAIGSFDPPTVTRNCDSGRLTYNEVWVAPASTVLYASDPAARRCLGASVQVDKGPALGDFNGSVPTVCVDGA